MQGVPTVDKKVVDLIRSAKTESEFFVMYLKTFGFEERPPSGIKQIWYKRRQILQEIERMGTVNVTKELKKTDDPKRGDTRTEQELLVLVLNELRYQTQLTKDDYANWIELKRNVAFCAEFIAQNSKDPLRPEALKRVMGAGL